MAGTSLQQVRIRPCRSGTFHDEESRPHARNESLDEKQKGQKEHTGIISLRSERLLPESSSSLKLRRGEVLLSSTLPSGLVSFTAFAELHGGVPVADGQKTTVRARHSFSSLPVLWFCE